MKKYLNILFILLAFSSCENAYNVDPDDEILEENAFNSVADLENGIIGVYSGISGSNVISYSSRFTDDLRLTDQNRGQGVAVHQWQIVPGLNEAEGLWDNLYSVINRTNRLLEASEGITATSTSDIALKTRVVAEARALRGYAHFELMRLFSETYAPTSLSVPYINEVVVFEQPARNTFAEVASFIEADFEFAANTLDASLTDNTRLTTFAVAALRARLALYAGNYDEAITFSTQVIDNVNLANTTEFRDIWTDNSEQEVLFKLKRVTGNGRIGTIFQDVNGDIFFGMSFNLLNHLFANGGTSDVRTFTTVDVPNFSPTNPTVGKYVGTATNPRLNDIKLLRVGEQYLIRAEAKARKTTPDLMGAAADVQTLKGARLLAGVANINFGTVTQALNGILSERRSELVYEGHRLFDLRRFNESITRDAEDCITAAGACLLNTGDFKFALPIPQAELFANDNMVQNTQY